MNSLSIYLIESLWSELSKEGVAYTTPDHQRGSEFTVLKSDKSSIRIQTSGGTTVTIQRESFIAAITFLLQHNHVSQENVCPIGASKDAPGPLDQATRVHSGEVMVIPYILPILKSTGIVVISGDRPNSTWVNL